VFSTLTDNGDNYVFSVRGKEFKLDYPQAKELVHMLTLAEKSIIEFETRELEGL
jgi:hypothetical protein